MAKEQDQFESGEVLDQRYRIEKRLAQGGFGSVYRATHLRLRQPVAIKLVASSVSEDARARERFVLEARALRNCQHPSTIKYLDFVEHDPQGRTYLVMEFIDGESLSALLSRVGTLPAARVGKLLRQLAGSLHEAHLMGIVHRDLKPENLMLVNGPAVEDLLKVIDFGLLKLGRSTPIDLASLGAMGDLTVQGMFMGTPGYAPPEGIMGGEPDGRYDIYSAGVIAFELLTGEKLYDIDREMPEQQRIPVILYHHVSIAPRPPSQVNRAVPPAFDQVILKALAKAPDQRFQTMLAFADAFDAALLQARVEAQPTVEVDRLSARERVTEPIDDSNSGDRPSPDFPLDATEQITPPPAAAHAEHTTQPLGPHGAASRLDETLAPPLGVTPLMPRYNSVSPLGETLPPPARANENLLPNLAAPQPPATDRPQINVARFTKDLPARPERQSVPKRPRDLLFWITIASATFFIGALIALLIRIFG